MSPALDYSRTQHLLVSVYGSKWEEVILAMFTVYVDDSGTDPKQHVAIATGLIIPAAQIACLDQEWKTLQGKEGFTDFHTSEFVFRNHKSEFAGWDDTKHRRVYDRVRQIAKKYGLKAGSVAINKQDYEEAIPESFRRLFAQYHYTWAASQLLSFLRTQRLSGRPRCDGFEYVIDWMAEGSEERIEIETTMARAEEVAIEDGNAGEFSNYSFRHRKEIPGLQCVDCVSWVAYCFARFVFRQTPLHPFAELGWQDFGGPLHKDGWLGAITIERHNLEKWYEEVSSDTKNFDKFVRAEERRLARQSNRVLNSQHDANAKGKTP